MITLDFDSTQINRLITHYVGNPMRDEDILISVGYTDVHQDTEISLLSYFLKDFHPIDFKNFKAPTGGTSSVFESVSKIFEDTSNFILASEIIARLLYEYNNDERIKEGDLSIVLFNDVVFDDELVNAIGIFKTETIEPYLIFQSGPQYKIQQGEGVALKGLDKGCIIFDVDEEDGYYALAFSKDKKQAKHWEQDFLRLKDNSDEFHYTQNIMSLAKDFVTKEVSKHDLGKTETISMLNKTMDYFKSNMDFLRDDFEETVFENEEVRQAFREFKMGYEEIMDDDFIPNSFEISTQAVKKQARSFKNIIKLDKNFTIKVDGEKHLIKQGADENGDKYYKLYYQEAH